MPRKAKKVQAAPVVPESAPVQEEEAPEVVAEPEEGSGPAAPVVSAEKRKRKFYILNEAEKNTGCYRTAKGPYQAAQKAANHLAKTEDVVTTIRLKERVAKTAKPSKVLTYTAKKIKLTPEASTYLVVFKDAEGKQKRRNVKYADFVAHPNAADLVDAEAGEVFQTLVCHEHKVQVKRVYDNQKTKKEEEGRERILDETAQDVPEPEDVEAAPAPKPKGAVSRKRKKEEEEAASDAKPDEVTDAVPPAAKPKAKRTYKKRAKKADVDVVVVAE